ncbi:hypothetical protein PHLGIDRAFT_116404 [Phlebiopsis gigantea 11061_1 CR5-6]|uniref:Non-haem dioxygenase N-terminal domain-containing protein n=1 Tax=Phlebiopsis gigantea (strain 11061_1 CR5-6) TaxID=745531 RepID=A0A0C3SAR6_PHLG1|nr:hypothetical protein PHLGIDRAFT_116404 [Phlebiopsis gigantea 11061_1 CR5-6]
MATYLSSIPILGFSLSRDPANKPNFLAGLRNALTNIGFYYLQNHTIPKEDIDTIISYVPRFFNLLPDDEKEYIGSGPSQLRDSS